MAGARKQDPVHIHAAARTACREGRYREGETLYRQAVAATEALFGRSHPHVAIVAKDLVELYDNQGRYDEARQLCLRIVGDIDPVEAAGANDYGLTRLAQLCRHGGHPEKAIGLYRAAIDYRRTIYGYSHPKVALCIAGMAEAHSALGNREKARALLRRAISMAEENDGGGDGPPELRRTLATLRDLLLEAA